MPPARGAEGAAPGAAESGRRPAGAPPNAESRAGALAVAPATAPATAKSAFLAPADPTEITPPHTEHRARTPAGGTFAGSTLKIERHSGHATFMTPPAH